MPSAGGPITSSSSTSTGGVTAACWASRSATGSPTSTGRTSTVAAGFDGIEYDIVDAYAQGRRVTGWRITYDTQLAYNLALAQMAHEDGLAVALKNDGGQIPDLVSSFDFAINEQCFQYHECDGG